MTKAEPTNMRATDKEYLTARRAIYLTVGLGLSGLLNVLLGLRIISQERALHPAPRIKAGIKLESIVGADPNGFPAAVRFGDSQTPTVLLILRPGCPWCDKNMPNWHALIDAKRESFRFVAV